ncbi:MAG TPA: flagellar biosynthesis protein FlgL [Rhodobacteraceae bacterium]|nr:flagellar biosynthesis protein FlgL [Paracoccaceae bacterium]
MTLTSIGDLSHALMIRSRSATLKQQVSRLTQELAKGETLDLAKTLGGDYGYLSEIERGLSRLQSQTLATTEAAIFFEAAQDSLELVRATAGELGSALLSTASTLTPDRVIGFSQRARQDLGSVIAALNASSGGRHVFSGVATGAAPLPAPETVLEELRTELTGYSTSAEIFAAADAWFEDPAGFGVIYQGADADLAPFEIGDGDQVEFGLRADDRALRSTIRDAALAALVADTDLGLGVETQKEILESLANRFLQGQSELLALQSDLGHSEERLESARVRDDAAKFGLSEARNALISADPFETATRLEEAQSQLEALYAVTVRSSRLSLMSFMS